MALVLVMTALLPGAAAADGHQSPEGHHDGNEGMVDGNDCHAGGWAVDPGRG